MLRFAQQEAKGRRRSRPSGGGGIDYLGQGFQQRRRPRSGRLYGRRHPRIGGGSGDDDDSGEYSGEHRPPLELQVPHQKASSPIDIPGRKVVAGAVGARGPQVPGRYSSKFGASHAGVGAGSVLLLMGRGLMGFLGEF